MRIPDGGSITSTLSAGYGPRRCKPLTNPSAIVRTRAHTSASKVCIFKKPGPASRREGLVSRPFVNCRQSPCYCIPPRTVRPSASKVRQPWSTSPWRADLHSSAGGRPKSGPKAAVVADPPPEQGVLLECHARCGEGPCASVMSPHCWRWPRWRRGVTGIDCRASKARNRQTNSPSRLRFRSWDAQNAPYPRRMLQSRIVTLGCADRRHRTAPRTGDVSVL